MFWDEKLTLCALFLADFQLFHVNLDFDQSRTAPANSDVLAHGILSRWDSFLYRFSTCVPSYSP